VVVIKEKVSRKMKDITGFSVVCTLPICNVSWSMSYFQAVETSGIVPSSSPHHRHGSKVDKSQSINMQSPLTKLIYAVAVSIVVEADDV
jgi:hypothetical protein